MSFLEVGVASRRQDSSEGLRSADAHSLGKRRPRISERFSEKWPLRSPAGRGSSCSGPSRFCRSREARPDSEVDFPQEEEKSKTRSPRRICSLA